jgi:hypothetical protein
MAGTGLGTVLLMVVMVMLIMSFWRQIAVFMLFVVLTVFCFGIYHIAMIIGYITR